jgi:hypothetical protein
MVESIFIDLCVRIKKKYQKRKLINAIHKADWLAKKNRTAISCSQIQKTLSRQKQGRTQTPHKEKILSKRFRHSKSRRNLPLHHPLTAIT